MRFHGFFMCMERQCVCVRKLGKDGSMLLNSSPLHGETLAVGGFIPGVRGKAPGEMLLRELLANELFPTKF